VAARRGAAGLAAELLVGADPVAALAAALQARFGGVALLCADALGGALLGVKWRAQARAARARACLAAAECGGWQCLPPVPPHSRPALLGASGHYFMLFSHVLTCADCAMSDVTR